MASARLQTAQESMSPRPLAGNPPVLVTQRFISEVVGGTFWTRIVVVHALRAIPKADVVKATFRAAGHSSGRRVCCQPANEGSEVLDELAGQRSLRNPSRPRHQRWIRNPRRTRPTVSGRRRWRRPPGRCAPTTTGTICPGRVRWLPNPIPGSQRPRPGTLPSARPGE